MKISLVVKGSPSEAADAARMHGFAEIHTLRHLKNSAQTVIVAEGHVGLAAHWFCEPSETIPGYGHQTGSLLLYTEVRP